MTQVQADKIPVVLAGREWNAKAVPIARIKKIIPAIVAAFQDIDTKGFGQDTATAERVVTSVFDKLVEAPHAVFSVFIKDLPKEIFTDEDEGVTFPELFDAIEKVLVHNRIGGLKNLLQRIPQWYPSLMDLVKEGNKALAKSQRSN